MLVEDLLDDVGANVARPGRVAQRFAALLAFPLAEFGRVLLVGAPEILVLLDGRRDLGVVELPIEVVAERDDLGLVVVVVGLAAVGFRLPGRRGVVSLEAQNLLDSDIGYVERVSFSDFTAESRFARERAIVGRVTLNF